MRLPARKRFTPILLLCLVGLLLPALLLLPDRSDAYTAEVPAPDAFNSTDNTVAFNPGPLLNLADYLLDQGRFQECVAVYAEIAEQGLNDPNTRDRAVRARMRQADILALFLDQPGQALALYEDVIKANPGHADLAKAYFNAAMLSYDLAGEPGAGPDSPGLVRAESLFSLYLEYYPGHARNETARYMLDRIRQERAGELVRPPVVEELFQLDAEPVVRVALALERQAVIELPGGGWLDAQGQRRQLAPGRYAFSASQGGVVLDSQALGERVELTPTNGTFAHGASEYAGRAVLLARSGRVRVVNALPMETYLAGVLAGEMPLSFQPEALKAQAVASRSYAYYLLARSRDKDYDLGADTAAQVYKGIAARDERALQAVAATPGEMLTADTVRGEPIIAYFHSHSGGVLEDDALVWGGAGDLPYYSVRPDPESQAYKPMDWEYGIGADELARLLRANGFGVKTVTAVRAAELSPSGRWAVVGLVTDRGELRMQGNSFRLMLGAGRLKSLLCTVRRQGGRFVFTGKGFGHGVGMSQWGAEALARAGQGYEAILARYYQGAKLRRLY